MGTPDNNSRSFVIKGMIVDVVRARIFPGELTVHNGKIVEIKESKQSRSVLIMPGFIDAHVHIESSMLVPTEFARISAIHGTVGTLSDPHEIGNVLGCKGVEYMIRNASHSPFHFYFGAPSCVPATAFESSGAVIDVPEIRNLLQKKEIYYLAEMMNYPGVLSGDVMVRQKIDEAKRFGKIIDGHAPGIRGAEAKRYCEAGISTDHECLTIEEARDKIKFGMKILIREGSAAKNFDTLIPLLEEYPDKIMFCSDDKHPDELLVGHMNSLVHRALSLGIDPFKVFRAAALNPSKHYKLNVGLLQKGDSADFIEVSDLNDFNVLTTYIRGRKVSEQGQSLLKHSPPKVINNFKCNLIEAKDLELEAKSGHIRVIRALDGQLITRELITTTPMKKGRAVSDVERDLLKLVVINRYKNAAPSIAFVTGIGLVKGAFASSVAHDCHNIIAVGVDTTDIARAVNLVIEQKGGLSYACKDEENVLPLPVAGLMSALDGIRIANDYKELERRVINNGSNLSSPFMTLSFLALLVIPELKLSDRGLFNGKSFKYVHLFV